jgi:dihydrofolate reductase
LNIATFLRRYYTVGQRKITIMKPRISLIAAVDSKDGIGKDNKIPWHLKSDLIRLKNLTKDNIVILGRKSYESMAGYYDKSGRQMPGKLYVVVTRDKDYKPSRENAKAAHSLDEAMDTKENEVFIIGGAQIFKEAIEKDLVDRIYLTKVEGDFDCDTFMPEYSQFNKILSRESGEENGLRYEFIDLEK